MICDGVGQSSGISVNDVTIRFANPNGQLNEVLARMSLEVPAGEFLCILGPSGCGKSTLLKAIAGFVQPTSGKISVAGQAVQRPDSDRGIVFQEYALFPWLTVADNILFGNHVHRRSGAERAQILQRYLSLVHLEAYARHYPSQLSGGMKQRVALARAWANGPDVLLLDEPFGALDAMTRRDLQTELLRIWQSERKTCVFVTHDVSEAVYLADRVMRFSANPARIAHTVAIDLPRPRDRGSLDFLRYIREIEAHVS